MPLDKSFLREQKMNPDWKDGEGMLADIENVLLCNVLVSFMRFSEHRHTNQVIEMLYL